MNFYVRGKLIYVKDVCEGGRGRWIIHLPNTLQSNINPLLPNVRF